MNRMKQWTAAFLMALPLFSCVSYKAYESAKSAEVKKDWDTAVAEYDKALAMDPDNMKYTISAQRAKLEASRVHFQKGKTYKGAADSATGSERIRLAQLAATELQLTVKLDPTNQYAAVEFGKAVRMIQDTQTQMSGDRNTIDAMKRRANITKAQPPQLNPASNEPISLNFPHDTPVKEIYRALGNAFGINILYDQAVKDDRISIELRDVTAQQGLERVMQAANHFYKVLDEKTIIVVPDNPQARRDYEDLVIRTFYLSNGDAEQVTNVVRTMIEARNVFPLKALNAITIRDTADKVRIAEKIIEANDKAKAEVVVDVELLQMDLDKTRDIGFALTGSPTGSGIGGSINRNVTDDKGVTTNTAVPLFGTGATQVTLRELLNSTNAFTFSVPTPTYGLYKAAGDAELLANPELRISEGEKATLHIGQRIPVPVGQLNYGNTNGSTGVPVNSISYQYQDVGIKVAMEPRVHHNNEVTLKLTVEVSSLGANAAGTGKDGVPAQPTFVTRTIESTIRLKDGETNFLAGLIRDDKTTSDQKTPFLGDIPILGRLFTETHQTQQRTDLVLTMTPHIVRMPDITEDDLAPMWVGTQNNLTFRGVSPRIESQVAIDPFTPRSVGNLPTADGEPGNFIQPPPPGVNANTPPAGVNGGMPANPFGNNPPQTPPPPPQNTTQPVPEPQANNLTNTTPAKAASMASSVSPIAVASTMSVTSSDASTNDASTLAAMRIAPRMGAQPATLKVKPGEEKLWRVVGMDLDGLVTNTLVLRYDPKSIDVTEVAFGDALAIDAKTPPAATIDREHGTIKIVSTDGKPLTFANGGEVVTLRLRGAATGETFLVIDSPEFHNAKGDVVMTAVTGGRARVE